MQVPATVAGLATGAALSACVAVPPAPACADPALARYLGQPLAVLVREQRLSEGAFKVDYPSPFGPTLEEFPDRLRVGVDETGAIRSIGCG